MSDISTLDGDPRAFFSRFDSIVLVANSAKAASVLAAADLGQRPLFIFFNKVFRIIDEPFLRDSLLISRSSPVGSSLIYRNELGAVMKLLDGLSFHGIVNMKIGSEELLSPRQDFGRPDVALVDLTADMAPIYPSGTRLPSTGFAVAVWLCGMRLGIPIRLAGFTGVREDGWRVYDVHDWTWEQIVLQVLYRKGMLTQWGDGAGQGGWPVEALVARFGEISPNDIELVSSQALSDRLSGANRAVDQILSTIKPLTAFSRFLRSIRPASRKAKKRAELLAKIEKES